MTLRKEYKIFHIMVSIKFTFEEKFDSIEILFGVSGQNITFHNTLHHIPGAPYMQ
jgi:hypothetical protein